VSSRAPASSAHEKRHLEKAHAALAKHGLLLLHDATRQSVSLLVAGEPVRGSWWAHPSGAAIFRIAEALDDRADVVSVKLVAGKVTFVHRKLWPALLGAASSAEPWQKNGLRGSALALFREIARAGTLESDRLPRRAGASEDIKALEARLLVVARQIHTASGKHAKVLESWAHFRDTSAAEIEPLPASEARALLERQAAALGTPLELPWLSPRAASRRRT
jgi:hypothetical protein